MFYLITFDWVPCGQLGLAPKRPCDLILRSPSVTSLHLLRSSDQLDLFESCMRLNLDPVPPLWNGLRLLPLQSAPPSSLNFLLRFFTLGVLLKGSHTKSLSEAL